MRSPRGCRSPCRFKVRAPNRFNWHLRPWTQHKSLRRAERGSGGGKWRRNNRIICICNTLLGQFLDSKWIWTHNDCNVSKSGGISLTNSDGRAWKTSWTPHATVEYSQRKKTPHGSLEGTIQAKLRLQGATEPDAFEDGKVGDGDVLWPSFTISFQPLI